MSRFRIGTYAGGPTGTSDLCRYVGTDPESVFQEYSEDVGSDLNGAPIEAGLPRATWRWEALSQAEFDALLDFLGTASSASVYIRTRTNAGASQSEFGNYQAIMARPKSSPAGAIVHRDVVVDFTALLAV